MRADERKSRFALAHAAPLRALDCTVASEAERAIGTKKGTAMVINMKG